MAQLNDFIKSLEKELTCSICEEIFTEPKQLHCLHSFCLKCIEKWNETCKNRRQRLTCPTCRSREDGDVSTLRSSFYLDSLTQLLLAMRNKSGKPDDKLELQNCVSCQEHVKLVAFCQQCQGMICTDCVNAHKKMKQLQEHQVIMFIDFKQEHVNSYISNQVHCEEKYHEKQKLEYFCQTCEKCICAKCSNTTHDTHKKLSIEEKADEMKRLINNSLHRVNQQKQRFVQELELSQQNMRRAKNEIETTKKEVSHHVQAQIKILKDHENAMKKTLDEILLEQKTANDEEQNEIIAVIQQLDAVNEQSKRLQDQNVDYSILQSQLPNRCEELMQTRSVLPSKPIKRNTSVYYTPQSLQDIGKIEENVTDPSRCSIELQNKEIRCGFVNKLAIVTKNSEGDVCYTNKGSIDVQIKDEDGCEVEIKLVENQTGKYIVTYKAEKLSQYEINVRIAGNTIKNSPIKVRTLDAKTNFKPVKIIGKQINFKVPVALDVNDNQEAAIVDMNNHRIVIFSKDGKCLHKFGVKGTRDGELDEPGAVVMYDDKLVIGDKPDKQGGRIQEFDVNGEYLRTIYKQEGTRVLRMCTTGDNISVISYCDIDNNKWQIAIKLFSKDSGQFIRDIPIATVTRDRKELPFYIAYRNNKYFLSYSLKNYIGVYDDNGGFLYKFGDEGKEEGQFYLVLGVAVYGEEVLVVCDGNNHRVQVFTQEGQYITSFGSHGSGVGQMNDPVDVAVTPDGKVFVLERSAGKRIQVWQ